MKTTALCILATSLHLAVQAGPDLTATAAKIDELVNANLAKEKITPNKPASDEVFVRRVYLDVVGRIPTLRETTDFLKSTDAAKRSKLIDTLLASDGYAQTYFNYWADILRMKSQMIGGNQSLPAFYAYAGWLKSSLRENKPYDQMVREVVTADGKSYEVAHYNLDMVLALGFRVRSPMAVRFRQWAADKLKEYITKGFVLDDDRLKNPQAGNDYFEELIQPVPGFPMPTKRKALSESPTAKEGSAYHCAPAEVWKCYARLHGNRVKTLEPGEALTNLISLVRFATGQQADLAPFPVLARQRFSDRLNQQETAAGHPNSNFHEFEGIGNQAGPQIP